MIYLHKLLPMIVSPMGLIFLLLGLNIIWRQRFLTVLCGLVLLIASLPVTSHFLWRELEKDYPPRAVGSLSQHQAVVVLSGMIGGFEKDGDYYPQWYDPDRFFTGVEVVRTGWAKEIIFTGGKVPWQEGKPEGETLRDYAVEMGINPEDIHVTTNAENTAQEAAAVKRILVAEDISSVLLVTSSFHMPRAVMLFEAEGIAVEAYATDFKAQGGYATAFAFLPDAASLNGTSSAIREFIGRAYYHLKLKLSQ